MIPCQPTLVNPKITKDSFCRPTQFMTQDDRINRMENQLIDMRLAVSALLETVTQHQRNFETIQRNFETIWSTLESHNQRFTAIMTEIRDIRLDMREMRVDMQEMQSEVRGLQTENRRILDILQNRYNNGDS
jgi:chromosome segregation ATPase